LKKSSVNLNSTWKREILKSFFFFSRVDKTAAFSYPLCGLLDPAIFLGGKNGRVSFFFNQAKTRGKMKQKVTCKKKGNVWKARKTWELEKDEKIAIAIVLLIAGYIIIRVLLG